MYCPQCLTEYREGFTECADCRVPLMPGSAPQPPAEGPVDLVTVLETADPFAVGLAKSSLEDAGIEFDIEGGDRDSRRMLGMATGEAGTAVYRVQVSREDEAEARELMEPLQNPDSGLEGIDGGGSVE